MIAGEDDGLDAEQAAQRDGRAVSDQMFGLGADADDVQSAIEEIGKLDARASQALMLTVRARALFDGRLAPSLDDVHALTLDAAALRTACEEDHELGYRVARRLTEVVASRIEATRHQVVDLYGRDRKSVV